MCERIPEKRAASLLTEYVHLKCAFSLQYYEKTAAKFNFLRKKPKKACMVLPVSDT